jgi:AraC family transcriptional regulator of adaptative response / DNA-3-methyladenine glycosylase II
MGAMTIILPAHDVCYRAVAGKDPRFDGWIYVGVTSTGIYCRPSCPARTPHQRNCRFFAAPGAAQQAGFRACRRCRPDTTPGSPQWNPRADVVARAMRLIADGIVDRSGVPGLAAAVGYSERQLNRLLLAEVGAGPLAIARAQRAQTARVLIENTALPLGEVAFAAGFASIRQFNDTINQVYARTPSTLRERSRGDHSRDPDATAQTITLRLPVREPFAARPIFDFLTTRAIDGVERAWREQDRLHYLRSCSLPHGEGEFELIFDETVPDRVTAVLRLDDLRDLSATVSRIRRLLDLDADPVTIDTLLGADPAFADDVATMPGVRVPGVIDGDELAFRAVIGQQVSVAGARTTLAGLTRRHGRTRSSRTADSDVRYLFPTAEALASIDPETLPMPRSRGRTLVRLADELASGRIDLSPGTDRSETREKLLTVPGIGPWTAGYIAMRALGDPDVLLSEDLVIRRELQRRGIDPAHTAGWAPWRSYAAVRLWQLTSTERTEKVA